MKKICITGSIVFILISFCSAQEKFTFGSFWSNIAYVQQQHPHWCFFAAQQIITRKRQCEFAGKYREWIGKGAASDCCPSNATCDPVRFIDIIPFWNYATSENWTNLVNSATVFNRYSNSEHPILPRLGIITSDKYETNLHAVAVYYVEISYEQNRNLYTITHDVWFSDPWVAQHNHLIESTISYVPNGYGVGPIYVID